MTCLGMEHDDHLNLFPDQPLKDIFKFVNGLIHRQFIRFEHLSPAEGQQFFG